MRGLHDNIGPAGLPDTRALLVVHKGRIVMETYAPGFGPTSRFISWSMAKSVTNALTGVMVRKGQLQLDKPAPVQAWRAQDDPRGAITLRHLLNMTSGLDNDDDAGGGLGFVTALLFTAGYREDATATAADVDLIHPPGTFWAYSTASSQIIGGLIHSANGADRSATRAFAYAELFVPLGARSMQMEFDKAGTFLAGSHMWASARDWARLGYLYLRDGVWDGRRILPEGWVDFTRTRAPASNNGIHGAHFWVSGEPAEGQWGGMRGSLGAFYMSGNNGQLVAMMPARDLVIVRLGEDHIEDWDYFNALPGRIADAFPIAGAQP